MPDGLTICRGCLVRIAPIPHGTYRGKNMYGRRYYRRSYRRRRYGYRRRRRY